MSEVRGTFEWINPWFMHNKLGRDMILVSNFMLMMNMNVRLAGTSDAELEALSEPLYNMAQEMFDGTWGTELVVDYKVTASAEIGHNTRGSRLHMHVGIKIRHHLYGWTGCYGVLGIVISAIMQNGNQSKLMPDKINELIDIFEASLRREPGFEQTKFTIIPVPSYKLLKTWGRNLSLQEFHQQYQHDESVEIYRQVIPDKTYIETFVDVNKTDVPPNAPKCWWRSLFSIMGKTELKACIQMPCCSPA
eukprot:m51a1_g13992 hypothetical protein (248) ;mRNA; f:1056578-1057747